MKLRSAVLPEEDYTRSFNNLIPHLNLSYNFGSSNLSLSYDGSISRPGIGSLNPFESYLSDNLYKRGNPTLKSAYTHKTGLDYSYFSNKFFLFAGLSYAHTGDPVVQIQSYDPARKAVINELQNITGLNQLHGNLYANYRPIPLLSLTVSGNASWHNLRDQALGLDQNDLVYNLFLMADLNFDKGWSVGAQWGNFLNAPQPYEKRHPFSIYSLSLGKSFLDGALNVRAVVNSPFDRYSKVRREVNLPGYSGSQNNYIIARSFGLNLTYNFNSGKTKQLQRDTSLRDSDQTNGVN